MSNDMHNRRTKNSNQNSTGKEGAEQVQQEEAPVSEAGASTRRWGNWALEQAAKERAKQNEV